MHLFISYSSRDGLAEAEALVRALEGAGHRCWIAPRDVKAGVPYPGQIVSAIEASTGFVILVTQGANESSDILQEVQLASSARKIIAPVIVRSTAPAPDLRYYIGVRHQIAFRDVATTVKSLQATFGPLTPKRFSPLPDQSQPVDSSTTKEPMLRKFLVGQRVKIGAAAARFDNFVGTFKPNATGHRCEVRAETGRLGTIIGAGEKVGVVKVQWDEQAWREQTNSRATVSLPAFADTIHGDYLEVQG